MNNKLVLMNIIGTKYFTKLKITTQNQIKKYLIFTLKVD